MSKTLISVLVVGVVVVGGYFAFSGNKEEKGAELANETSNEERGKKMAFSEFMKQGGSYKCSVKQSMNDFENSGTIYISGKGEAMKTRGDWSTVAEGMSVNTSFIMRDGYYYTWSDTMPNMNFKMKVDASAGASANSQNYSWNAEQIGDYNCEAWSADESKFAIPTNITFQAMGS